MTIQGTLDVGCKVCSRSGLEVNDNAGLIVGVDVGLKEGGVRNWI